MKNIDIKEFNKILKTLKNEERRFIIFRYLLEYPEEYLELKSNLDNKKDLFKLSMLANKISEEKEIDINSMICIESHFNRRDHYKKILQEAKKLAIELNLNDSLEIANLFTYLLWKGYFSKNKKLLYQSEDRYLIPCEYSHDIMSGRGVCLNFSDMLSDFINSFDYSSATLFNYIDSKTVKTSYRPKLKRNYGEENFERKMYFHFMTSIQKIYGNHAFNLIKDGKKLYIYDSTNLALYNLKNTNESKLVNGRGVCLLKPCLSYLTNNSKKSIDTLDFFNTTSKFNTAYGKIDFIMSWEKCMELFKENKCLLDDFYTSILSDINYIDRTNVKAKKLI